jgi:putative Ca2+/H+ antiporter (TMEM165/GDT1 family)
MSQDPADTVTGTPSETVPPADTAAAGGFGAVFLTTFTTVFLAELGDKTQLAIVTISGTSLRPGAVFAGSSAALVLASLLGAGAGGSLSAVIPTNLLQLAAAVGFLILGLRLIVRAAAESGDEAEQT